MKIQEVRKTLAGALALVAQAVTAGLLHGQALVVAEAVLVVAGSAGVYGVRNKPHVDPAGS